ncbi:hypothetical protein DRJ48_02610 [Candidatus Woesearchaeota archaeon]|nr:hypothetical protein [Candidatus Woesearchaeota archaeon]RLE42843.1 MAG: hypothetical protein DRJ48_02610 [Candidatus Woesearchaeota archaeon]
MGFLDSVKGVFKKRQQEKQQQPLPQHKPTASSSSAGIAPPPKVTDFDEEIPELPDLDIPEGLGEETKIPSPPTPQPESTSVPPPQGQLGKEEAEPSLEPKGLELPEIGEQPKEEQPTEIKFQKIETPKLKQPIERPIETKPSSEPEQPHKVEHKEVVTYVSGGQEFIREFAFARIVDNLKEVEETITTGTHYDTLLDLDAQKQNAIKEFRKEVKAMYEILEEIDAIAFRKG